VGWGLFFVDSVFLKRDWYADKEFIIETFSKYQRNQSPMWLMIFPEGTRQTPAKLKRSIKFAQKRKLPIMNNVMIPRTKGFIASVQNLREYVTAVYDVTIGYANRPPPRLLGFFLGGQQDVYLFARRFSPDQLPETEKELSRWLMERFQRKNKRLEQLDQEGEISNSPLPE
jgi:1-acyl-sn-glycerol-3-phosphate acyltransferase